MIKTRLNKIIILTSFFGIAPAFGDVIFRDNFDNQKDWTSDTFEESETLPDGWYAHRADDLWSPLAGDPNHHPSAEILSDNGDKARGGKGKSFVAWRESHDPGWKKWNSDSILVKYFPQGFTELYVEFWINFSNETIETYHSGGMGASKLFRIYHFNGNEEEKFTFFGEENSPKYLWDIGGNSKYGIRNTMSFYARGPNHGKNGIIPGLPVNIGYNGDVSLSYKTSLEKMAVDGSDASLPNKVNGGLITGQSGSAALDHVFGSEDTWTKMGFYIRMNSAPGIQDGVVMQWMDNQRIFVNESIDWIRSGWDMVKWNAIAISGNDFFRGYDNDIQHEEWYAIDDIVIRDDIPNLLINRDMLAPNAPSDLKVE